MAKKIQGVKNIFTIQKIREHIYDKDALYNDRPSKKALGKLLHEKYPDVYASTEDGRHAIRRVTNSIGVREQQQEYDELNELFKCSVPSQDEYVIAKEYKLPKKKIYIITAAQDSTPVQENFWRNILKMKDVYNAGLSVIAMRYENPTSIFNSQKHKTWVTDVLPYLDASRHDLNNNVTIMSDIKTRPTAVNPLMGMEGISGHKTCVFGHSRVHLKTLPVLEGYKEKFLLTTGMCTVENYTDTAAGKKGEFHHTLGCVVIEIINDESFCIRQITATDDGNFTDLYYSFTDGEVDKVEDCQGLILGDLHSWYLKYEKMQATKSLINRIKPKYIVLHDVIDFDTINPHEAQNFVLQHQKKDEGDLMSEIEDSFCQIEELAKLSGSTIVIPRSNHHNFLDRWINERTWKNNHKNAGHYVKILDYALNNETPKGLYAALVDEYFKDKYNVITLGDNDMFRICEFETSQHGHRGLGGSRGSVVQYRKLSTKAVTAHTHSPSRLDGLCVVGCSCEKRLGYNNGMSDWAWCDGIIHNDGKFQHIIYDSDYKYTSL